MAHLHAKDEAGKRNTVVVHSPGRTTAVVAAVEVGATEAANTGTVGLYYVREHVRQSLPTVLQASRGMQATSAAARDATYAASHSRDFADTLRRELPAALHRMESALRDASWAAADVCRRHRELQQQAKGGSSAGSSSLGSLLVVPPRLRGLWLSGVSPGAPGGGGGGEPSGSEGMYGPD